MLEVSELSNEVTTVPVSDLSERTPWDEAPEGELAVDIWQDAMAFYVRTAVAGVDPADLEVTLEGDLLMIRGARREEPVVPDEMTLVRECHFGRFSRTVILPEEVNGAAIRAQLRNGILLVTVPKLHGGAVKVAIDADYDHE